MAINNPVKVKNWHEIVRALKLGHDFGIHGARHENLAGIIEDSQKGMVVIGHYFAVGEREKELNDNEFYQRLWASIDVALGFSTRYDIKENKAVFDGLPSIVLGIHNHIYSRGIITNDSGNITISSYDDGNGNSMRAFPIRHDFIPELFSVRCLEIQESEIEKINSGLEKFCAKRDFDTISKTYFVSRELIKRMVLKIYRELKQKRLNQESY